MNQLRPDEERLDLQHVRFKVVRLAHGQVSPAVYLLYWDVVGIVSNKDFN